MKYEQEPLVTIITPVYNRPHYIKQTVESVLNQTYKNIEYIILDDASTDNTLEVIKQYKDSRIKIIEQKENIGNLKISSLGMDLAKGFYMGIVDSDDFLERTCVEECVRNIGSAGMIYTQARYVGNKQGIVSMSKHPYSKDRLLEYFMTFHFRLYKTELWHKIKPLTNVWHAWDYDLSLRMSEVTEIKHIKKPLYNWRIHKGNLHTDKLKIRKDMATIREEAKKRRSILK